MAILQQLEVPRLEERRLRLVRVELSVKTMNDMVLVLLGV